MDAFFDFYGLTVGVDSPTSALAEEVRRDFKYFERPLSTAQYHIEMHLAAPPYEQLPTLPASLISPRNVTYCNGACKYLDYFGRGLAIVDASAGKCTVYSKDADLAHEIAYLFLLSTIGQHLDALALHRIHALGVAYGNHGLLLLLPSGGGKSTMALQLLRQPGFRLLSEDTPLVDRRGYVHPFPLRLGIHPGQEGDIPGRYLRTVARMEFDPKTLIDLDYIGDRIAGTVPASAILVGERNSGAVSDIMPLGRAAAFQALFKNLVVGLGVYQGIEFVLDRGLWELLSKTGVALSRAASGVSLMVKAPAFRFVLGCDRERNTRCLLEFVERRFSDEPAVVAERREASGGG